MNRDAPFRFCVQLDLVAIVVVIVVIPITVGMPPVAVFVPPAMPLVPAAFPRFAQFAARVIGLSAVPPVMLRGFVEFVVRPGDAALASIVVIGRCPGHCPECQQARKGCTSEHCLCEKLLPSRLELHMFSILPNFPPAEMGSGPNL
jgi:hypothetical protein